MSRTIPLLAIALLCAAGAPATAPAPGKTTEIAADDGASAGMKSIAGSGHAVVLDAPAGGAKLIAVKVFGSRYGTAQPPQEDFNVWLCDADGNQVKEFAFPYKQFLRGDPRWVTLKLPEATDLPAGERFILCIGFDPHQTKGVYVHHDKSLDGDSRTGLPGQLNDAFGKGDWMIRAVVRAN